MKQTTRHLFELHFLISNTNLARDIEVETHHRSIVREILDWTEFFITTPLTFTSILQHTIVSHFSMQIACKRGMCTSSSGKCSLL